MDLLESENFDLGPTCYRLAISLALCSFSSDDKHRFEVMAFRSPSCRFVLNAMRQSTFNLRPRLSLQSPIPNMRPASVAKIQTATVATNSANRLSRDEVCAMAPLTWTTDFDSEQAKAVVSAHPTKLRSSVPSRRIAYALEKLDKAAAKLLFCCLLGGIAVTLVREMIWPRTNLLRSKDAGPITLIW